MTFYLKEGYLWRQSGPFMSIYMKTDKEKEKIYGLN